MSSLAAQTRLILRNDLRLLWRDFRSGRAKAYASFTLLLVVFLLFNAAAIALFFGLHRTPPIGFETMAWLFFGFLMLGAAMNHAISVLFERADFDLLLASPVSPRAILLARLAAMTTGAALGAALFLLPLLDGAVLALSPHYAAGYAVWLLLSCTVASAGVWFTLLLVKWLGPRRARTWAQVVAAVLGASVYLLTQGQNLLPIEARGRALERTSQILAHPLLAFVARAGRGEGLPLLALGAITAVFATVTTRLLARMFIGGVQEAGAIAPRRKRAPGRRRAFTEGVMRATFLKDIRLIVRDPLLLAQILPNALYILPALFSFSRLGGIGILAPLALVLATQFSTALTAVSTAGEECWDLIRMSPAAERRLRRAKMAAGMALPLALCGLLCGVLALTGRPGLALLTLVFSLGCAGAGAWLQVVQIRPTPRRDVLKRGGGGRSTGTARNLVGSIIMMIGAAGLGFANRAHWITAIVLLGITALAVTGCFTLCEMEDMSDGEPSGGNSGGKTGAPGPA